MKNSNTIAMVDIVRPDPASVHPAVEGWIQRPIAVELFKSAGLDFEAEKKKAQREEFTPVRLASANFISGSSVPSICRWSSHFGILLMNSCILLMV